MILTQRVNGVFHITLDRPERRNALSLRLLSELADALSASSLAGAYAVVMTGAGPTFSAGADLSELKGTAQDAAMDDAIATVVAAIAAAQMPVIAALNGPCIGGAVDLVLACDLRVASERSYLQVPATRLGLLYNPAAIVRLHAQFSRDVLDRLLVHGERFDAREAFVAGLVTHTSSTTRHATEKVADSDGEALNAAAKATAELLDDLDNDRYDPARWEERRREILDSPERAAAIRRAQKKRPK